MKKVAKVFGSIVLIIIALIGIAVIYIKTALPNVGPAPELKIQKTAQRVERGKYLANHVSVCMDCHSSRNWDLYAGPLLSGNFGGGGEKFSADMGFPGNFYARNITPHKLGKWTDGEIFRAITTGVTKDGDPLFPVMPYESFSKMDPEDVYSIISYLRTLEPVQHEVPESEAEFPVNIILHTMPTEAKPGKKPAETDKLNYGKYLVTVAACVECHSKRNKGAIIKGTEFGGGMEFKMAKGTARSANITPDNTSGIGQWTEEAFVARFKAYADSSYTPQPIGQLGINTPMPWNMYAGMKESDLRAIYTYLRTLPAKSNTIIKFDPFQ